MGETGKVGGRLFPDTVAGCEIRKSQIFPHFGPKKLAVGSWLQIVCPTVNRCRSSAFRHAFSVYFMRPSDKPPSASEGSDVRAAWLRDVFQAHQQMLLAYAMRMTGGRREWAEEAVQETFLRLCGQARESVDDHLKAWLFKVCRSRIIDMQRTNHATNSVAAFPSSQLGNAVDPYDPTDSPEAQFQRSEETQRLRELIEQLPQRQRELLHLKIHGQLSYRDMAEASGISVSNVGFLLHQAMRTLRDKLSTGDAVS